MGNECVHVGQAAATETFTPCASRKGGEKRNETVVIAAVYKKYDLWCNIKSQPPLNKISLSHGKLRKSGNKSNKCACILLFPHIVMQMNSFQRTSRAHHLSWCRCGDVPCSGVISVSADSHLHNILGKHHFVFYTCWNNCSAVSDLSIYVLKTEESATTFLHKIVKTKLQGRSFEWESACWLWLCLKKWIIKQQAGEAEVEGLNTRQ